MKIVKLLLATCFALCCTLPLTAQKAIQDPSTGLYGATDKKGKTIVPCIFTNVQVVDHNIVVDSCGLYGVFNNKGQ